MEKINAYILAGGKSRRLGVNKLHVRVGGQSLLEHTIDTCNTSFEQVKLVAGSRKELSRFGCSVVVDSPLARGPMAGVIAALEDCRSDRCFITAADLPDLTNRLIKSILSQYQDQQYLGVIEPSGLQPLCGIYDLSSLDVLKRAARGGEYSLNRTMQFLNHSGICPPGDRWRNINYPRDLAAGESHV
jgi:molybdopterin-guanine dinucleotide biosynthesis protein A